LPPVEVGDTLIIGPGGTLLRVPKDAFCTDISRVRFQIEEMPGIGEMMLNDLPSQTGDGQCLSSGGVVRMRATVDGKEVQPCAGKQVEVTIPTDAVDPSMAVYELQGSGEARRWVLSEIPLAGSGTDGRGYNFRTPFMGAVNIDKPAGVPVLSGLLAKIAKRDRGLVVRSRRMDYDRSYLASRTDNMVVKGDQFKPRKMRFTACALRMDGQFAGVFKQADRTYFVGKPLTDLKFKRLGNRYVLRKRDFLEVSEEDLKAQMLAMTTE
jgi:hypothetical protein